MRIATHQPQEESNLNNAKADELEQPISACAVMDKCS